MADRWVEQYRGKVSQQELNLLERAQATLMKNIVPRDGDKPLQWEPRRGIAPSLLHYQGVWNWDAAFHAIAVARWDPELARDQIGIMLEAQLPSGALPDVLYTDGRSVTDFGKPPVMPWACAIVDRYSPDDNFLRWAYDKFLAYEAHWRRDRGGDRDGLFHYDGLAADEREHWRQARLESGWDDSVRWDKASYLLWTVDLNCFMVMLYRAMGYMATRLGRTGDRAEWEHRQSVVSGRINEKLWNPQAGAYVDVNYETGEFSDVLSPASFHPLYVGIASQDQAARLADLAADPARFYPGMPSVAYDNPEYRSDKYWRGPTWLNISYFAVRGLKDYGHTALAEDIRRTILDWCSRNEDYLYEYYDSRSGQGIGVKQYSWTAAFVIEFIVNWAG